MSKVTASSGAASTVSRPGATVAAMVMTFSLVVRQLVSHTILGNRRPARDQKARERSLRFTNHSYEIAKHARSAPVIDAEAAALFESGRSLIVCTIDEQGMPDAARAWAIKVLDGGERLRISISDDARQAIE